MSVHPRNSAPALVQLQGSVSLLFQLEQFANKQLSTLQQGRFAAVEGIAPVYSNASRVPTVESVARLGDYATTDLFSATEKARFIYTLEANIMAKLNTVTNVTITKVSPGSINVANSVAFTGADSDMAKANQGAFASLLGSTGGVSSIYGTTFGAVTVSQVKQTTSPNPSDRLTS
ncbi:hypothetical protein ABBQ32_001416 [Trebouxia sp. C0010 RCD-2024]